MTTVSNNAELMTALSGAAGGERIELTAGDYGAVKLIGINYPSGVTIVSADPLNPGIIANLLMKTSSYIIFDGILFDYVDTSDITPFAIKGSVFITIRNSVFNGADVVFGVGRAVDLTSSTGITLENNEMRGFERGIVAADCVNLVIRANDIHGMSEDAIDIPYCDTVLIEGNWLHDAKVDSGSGAHADMIQCWTKIDRAAAKNIIIRGNFLDAGTGSRTQSIFLRNEVVDQGLGSFEDYAYSNILIENNVIYNNHAHGITVGETDGLVARNNTLLFDAFVSSAVSPGTAPPRFAIKSASLNVVIDLNITDILDFGDNLTGDNLLVQKDDSNGENYYGDLFVNPFTTPAVLADLRAKAGGLIETNGYGAEMTRSDIDITLEVGPALGTEPDPVPDPLPGVCEALLAEALTVVADLGVQLSAAQTALALMTAERDVALGERDTVEAALVSMTAERDAALAARDEALQSESAALDDLETAQTQLAAAQALLSTAEIQLLEALARINAARLALDG